MQQAANEADDPGAFTALIGYEFTPLLPQFGVLHRNVIFRGEEVIPHPASSMDVRNQSEFFSRLDAGCTSPCRVLTIPHNTNYSWGLAFAREDEDGTPYTEADLERIVRIDRLAEVTQFKGTSECQVGVGAADEGRQNQFRYGMIGSTDTHTSDPATPPAPYRPTSCRPLASLLPCARRSRRRTS